jgi:hypothetical protein
MAISTGDIDAKESGKLWQRHKLVQPACPPFAQVQRQVSLNRNIVRANSWVSVNNLRADFDNDYR